MPVATPIRQPNDPLQPYDPTVDQLVGAEEVSVVVKVVQKPAQLPERPVVVIEPGADVTTRIFVRLEN
jgi:hypothetical protein